MGEGTDVGIVDGPQELTPGWITAALDHGGHGLRVIDVVSERIGTGQMGATYRMHLTYDGSPGPATLVAKLGADDPAARALVAPGSAAEVGFYTALAHTDRKSVVWGTSVSVRVDLGGRRLLKKK